MESSQSSEEEFTKDFPIYFSDLTKECQTRLLKFVGVESASDMNWDMDILPLAEYPKPEDLNS